MSILLMGGDMQAQGHAQVLVNILDLGANVQAATDMARFYHSQLQPAVSRIQPLRAARQRARRHNLTVVTRNVRDFDRLGVRTLNPWAIG
jgi:gamma-glutamyltranspeptidase